jgi:hypothetical protein
VNVKAVVTHRETLHAAPEVFEGPCHANVARIRLSGKMAHDDLVFPPSVSARDHPARRLALFRFTLSYRDVEDLLAERSLDISYETVRRWVLKFGPLFARELCQRPRPTTQWHLDEMAVMIAGRRFGSGARLTTKARFSTC